jgi:hypothetical protein
MESKSDSPSRETRKSNQGGGATAINAPARRSEATPGSDPSVRAEDTLLTRFLRWLYPEQRRTSRHTFPPIVSYLGALRTAPPYKVADICISGFYMFTPERWLLGTEMPVTLQRIDSAGQKRDVTITLLSRVVRCGPDGVGFSFAPGECESDDSMSGESESGPWAGRAELVKFLEGLKLSEFDTQDLERAS